MIRKSFLLSAIMAIFIGGMVYADDDRIYAVAMMDAEIARLEYIAQSESQHATRANIFLPLVRLARVNIYHDRLELGGWTAGPIAYARFNIDTLNFSIPSE